MSGLAQPYIYDTSYEVPLDDIPAFLRRGLEYWSALKGDRVAPSWADFDLLALPASLVPFVTVIDIREPLERSVYRFWGTGHVEAKGIDRSGETLAGHPQGRSEVVLAEYVQLLERAAPIAFRREIHLPDPKPILTQISLRLPLSSDGRGIDQVISMCDWLSLKDHWKEFYGAG